MVKKIKQLALLAGSFLALAVPALVPATVAAQSTDKVSGAVGCGVELDANAINASQPANCPVAGQDAGTKVNRMIQLVINIFSLVVGVVSIIMIIIGGLKYITSGGDSSNVSSAKNTILYAVIGLVVVALAQFLVRFVFTKVTENAA